MFHYLALILIPISWLTGIYIVIKWRDKDLRTISKHAASSTHASWLFGSVLVIGGLMLYWWQLTWFASHLYLGNWFKILITTTVISQLITGIVPDKSGRQSLVHRIAAFSMAVLFLPDTVAIIQAPKISVAARIIDCVLLVYLLTTFALFVLVKKATKRYLLFQALYIVVFQLIILTAAYL